MRIDRIIDIESSFNPLSFNSKSKATGLMQITPVCLDDYNQYHVFHFKMEDMTDPIKNLKVGIWYLEYRIPILLNSFNIVNCELTRLVSFNWGIRYCKDWYELLPKETRNYINKYFNIGINCYE